MGILAAWVAQVGLLVLPGLAGGPTDPSSTGDPTEYEVKAAFVFNFLNFVEWPAERFESPRSPFVVGVLGKDPFGGILDRTLADKKVQGRPIVLRRVSQPDPECHLLFVAGSEPRAREVADALAGKGVLLVGESRGFASQGGMIGFYLEDSRVGFEINPKRARREKLEINSRLLKLARVVEDADPP